MERELIDAMKNVHNYMISDDKVQMMLDRVSTEKDRLMTAARQQVNYIFFIAASIFTKLCIIIDVSLKGTVYTPNVFCLNQEAYDQFEYLRNR